MSAQKMNGKENNNSTSVSVAGDGHIQENRRTHAVSITVSTHTYPQRLTTDCHKFDHGSFQCRNQPNEPVFDPLLVW